MKQIEKKIILDTSDEAAKLVTVTGWVSSDGRFWGKDERAARYAGCTHSTCECGKLMERAYTKCEDCRHKADIERYNKLPFKEWDGDESVYSHACDKYFFNEEDLVEYCEENEIEPQELRLVICEQNNYNEVESDYWADIMPDDGDGDLPKELQKALDNLNSVIHTLPPCSYYPGKIRTEYKQ
jgi:hypothetical protein